MATATKKTAPKTNGTPWQFENAAYERECARNQFASDARIVRDILIEAIEGTGDDSEVEMITSTVVSRNEDGTVVIVLGIQNSTAQPARHVKVSITRADG
jgi:hypothetical protein